MTEKIVRYEWEGEEQALSFSDVKNYIATQANVSDKEVIVFMELCKARKLNPWIREAYLIKFGNAPATTVVGKDVFTRRANNHSEYDGMEAGVVVVRNGELHHKEGSCYYPALGEVLIGGWAKVYKKNVRIPSFDEVTMEEYAQTDGQGNLKGTWLKMPATMIRKVAIVHALREAFPEEFGGMYSQEEINSIDQEALPTQPISATVITADNPSQPDSGLTPLQVAAQVAMPLGKHKGKLLGDLVKTERSYCDWYLSNGNDSDLVEQIRLLCEEYDAWESRKAHGGDSEAVSDVVAQEMEERAAKTAAMAEDGSEELISVDPYTGEIHDHDIPFGE